MDKRACKVIDDCGLAIFDESGGIALHLTPGDIWLYKQDENHQERYKVLHGDDVCVSISKDKFKELFMPI